MVKNRDHSILNHMIRSELKVTQVYTFIEVKDWDEPLIGSRVHLSHFFRIPQQL